MTRFACLLLAAIALSANALPAVAADGITRLISIAQIKAQNVNEEAKRKQATAQSAQRPAAAPVSSNRRR